MILKSFAFLAELFLFNYLKKCLPNQGSKNGILKKHFPAL